MRAGEHDDVRLAAHLVDEAGDDLGADVVAGKRLAADIGLGHAGKVLRADEAHVAAAGEGLDEVARIGALDRAGGGEHRDEAGAGALGGGLDGRHRADEGHVREGGAQVRPHQREGRVAGDDADFRVVLVQQPAEEIDDMRLQRRLLPAAIGKARIVRDIGEVPLGHQHARLAQHGEAADAAVEDEDGFRATGCHGAPWAGGCGCGWDWSRHAAIRA